MYEMWTVGKLRETLRLDITFGDTFKGDIVLHAGALINYLKSEAADMYYISPLNFNKYLQSMNLMIDEKTLRKYIE